MSTYRQRLVARESPGLRVIGLTGPLSGLRVVDASRMLATPLAAQILGDFGANPVKVEPPTRPDQFARPRPQIDGHTLWRTQDPRKVRRIAIRGRR